CRGGVHPGAVRQERLDKPTLGRMYHAHAACSACSGRWRRLLVAQNVDALTATPFVRDRSDAGGRARRLEQARSMARTSADIAGIPTSRARRSVTCRTPEAMAKGQGRRGDAPAVGGLHRGDTRWHYLPRMCAGLRTCVPKMSPRWAGKMPLWAK